MDEAKQLLAELEEMFRKTNKYDDKKYNKLMSKIKFLSEDFLREEADKDNSYAQVLLLFGGKKIMKPYDNSLFKKYDIYLLKSAYIGNKYGQYYYARSLLNHVSYDKFTQDVFDYIIKYLEKSSDQDFCPAHRTLAYLHIMGHHNFYYNGDYQEEKMISVLIKSVNSKRVYDSVNTPNEESNSVMNVMAKKIILPLVKKINKLDNIIAKLKSNE